MRAIEGSATEVALTGDGQHNVQPAWSPDGSQIAFHSHARGGVWVMPARGGVPRQIAAEGSHPAWSSDGQRIAFQSDEPSDVSPSAFGAQSGVDNQGRRTSKGTRPRQLTDRGQPLGGHASPAWTADGRFIAFSVFDGARNNGVWIVSRQKRARRGNCWSDARSLRARVCAGWFVTLRGRRRSVHHPYSVRQGLRDHLRRTRVMPVPGVAGVRGADHLAAMDIASDSPG